MGLDLKSNTVAPGSVVLVRNSDTYHGVGESKSINRAFSLTTTSAVESNNFDLTFHYLNTLLNGIQAGNLQLFRSESGDNPFENLRSTALDTVAKTLTRTGISGLLAATFTLGDKNNPLPVTLVSFSGVAAANGVNLNWRTASELNNKGFAVERQLLGGEWQQVGFVVGTNAANGSTYKYFDGSVPAGATQAYYRLRQQDLDGKATFSKVVAVALTAGTRELTVSPVPVKDGPLTVAFAEANQAGSEVLIINTQGQRVGRFTTVAGSEAALSLPVSNLAPGVYILRVQVPGQAVRHARFVKE